MSLITKNVYRKIENELYAYPQKMQSLTERRNDIIYGTSFPDVMVSGGQLSNLTASKGAKLAEVRDSWVTLLDDAMKVMPTEFKLLIKYRYFENMSYLDASNALHVSKTLFYAWQESMILYLALKAAEKGLIRVSD